MQLQLCNCWPTSRLDDGWDAELNIAEGADVQGLHDEIKALQATVAAKNDEIAAKDNENALLKATIDALRGEAKGVWSLTQSGARGGRLAPA